MIMGSRRTNGFTEEITLEGHIIDSWVLPKVFDAVMDLGGSFDLEEIRVGRRKDEPSFARLKVSAESEERLHQIIDALQTLGGAVISNGDAQTEPAPADGVLPDHFYSTTNLPTQVRLGGRWIDVGGTEMDLVIVVDRERETARMIPMGDIRKGDPVVVGHGGIRVVPLERSREREIFSFMNSGPSSERPKRLVIADIAKQMRETRARPCPGSRSRLPYSRPTPGERLRPLMPVVPVRIWPSVGYGSRRAGRHPRRRRDAGR